MSKVALGAVALATANIVKVIVQALVVPLLARFVTPAEFGLVSIALPFLTFIMIFGDAGIALSLLRSKAESESLWSTAFWLVLLVGGALSCLLVFVGQIIAWVFGQPVLATVLSTLAVIPFLQGLTTIPYMRIYQRERLAYLATVESVSILVGAIVSILMAALGAGLWALVFQQLGYWLIKLIGILIAAGFLPKLQFNLRLLKEHVKFARDLITFRMIDFFSRGVDPLVVGKVLGVEAAGYFVVATQIVRLPRMLLIGPISTAIYPRLVRVHNDPAELRVIFLSSTRILAAVIFSLMAFAAVESKSIFSIVLSERWLPAANLFAFLVPVNALMAVTSLNGTVLMAINRTDVQVLTATEYTLLRFVILCATVWGGLEALAIGFNVAFGLYFYRFMKLFLPTVDCGLSLFIDALARPGVVAIIFAGTHAAITWWADPSLIVRLAIAAALLLACWSMTFLTLRRTFLRDFSVLRRNFKG
ncbi:lipopolysaccharide biosynthesis protein [Microvirga arabica]|uniref:lipopolysaccharide biosynthesis protein n=1 Tax=Microvirga arabica TaxID=1128671 RepID=UPI0019394E21|nr:lipopolysaccharide biosynthesis protein [Microvirga arabica]MBM1175484.1 lipopolysaccharide biosynthesis protein [Microvirga arabica]